MQSSNSRDNLGKRFRCAKRLFSSHLRHLWSFGSFCSMQLEDGLGSWAEGSSITSIERLGKQIALHRGSSGDDVSPKAIRPDANDSWAFQFSILISIANLGWPWESEWVSHIGRWEHQSWYEATANKLKIRIEKSSADHTKWFNLNPNSS